MAAQQKSKTRSLSPEAAHQVQIMIEHLDSKIALVLEGQAALRQYIDDKIESLRVDLTRRIDVLELAVRQNTADIKKNSEDIKKNSEDIKKNSEDIARLSREVAELRMELRATREEMSRKAEAERVRALERRVSALEARVGTSKP